MSKGLEALENIKRDMEYVTRLDFVKPIVRGEVQQELYKIYHRETPELDTIEKELKALEIIKRTAMKLVSLEDDTTICIKGRHAFYDNELYKSEELTQEEYDLLKEVLK